MEDSPRQSADRLTAMGVPPEVQEALPAHGIGTMAEHMGIVFEELTAERAVARFPVERNTQPYGLVHGGAHVALAETLGSMAANVFAGPEKMAVGLDVNATHQRGASSGWVTGTCTAIHLGRTLCVHEIVMTDDDGRRLSTARITNLLVDRKG
ncbi:hotdog fold thioesterase [Rothia kristinae]|uniref:Thioesterase n=1 Tax=Rothia kristinae TaxID=37923 RepID=A0A199PI76_9MICC|nr:hotdog fold thioesterase [Rothia kristinae]MCT1357639.1 hotdog fold thioesterase [Rothia kristinae]MCT1394078.1 hotdog fold thioesterase [Rothia kristinae]MCT1506758.1 hotdog fold thioesterase [Rothia kristinae]MCT2039512.1 hotdog fold thioesterase [Rothia kristinae]MCT2244394.1 hotdog fold thioesterase [Rothia kristinae]